MNGAQRLVSIFLLFCAVTVYSQTPCIVTLPITVTVKDGTIVKHLPPESLATNTNGISLQPDFAADDSKRRILIVLDGSSELHESSLEAEKLMARTLVDNARPGDSFALISGNGVPIRMQFSTDNALVLKAIDGFSPNGRKGKQLGLFDAINEGLSWFATPEFGDSVLLLPGLASSSGHENRSVETRFESCSAPYQCTESYNPGLWYQTPDFSKVDSKIKPKELDDALVAHGVRLFVSGEFGAIAPVQVGISVETGGLFFIYPEGEWQRSKAGNSTFVSRKLRGEKVEKPGGGKRIFQLDDATQKSLSAEALKIYGAIALIYRVSVRSFEEKQTRIILYLRPAITSKLPTAFAHHPILLPGCAK